MASTLEIALSVPLDFGQCKKDFEHRGKEVVRLLSHIDLQNVSKI